MKSEFETEITQTENGTELVITRKPNSAPDDTIWGVAQQIVELVPEAAPHIKVLEAKIKRLVHYEKLSTLTRLRRYFQDVLEAHPSLKEFVELKIQTHEEWSQKSDKDIVTW